MKIQEIAFVCCAVSDMNRARAFYEGILGLKPNAPVGPDPYCIEYKTSAPEHSQSKLTQTGLFLLMACRSHSKWKTLTPLSSICANTASPSSFGPTETKVCHWAAFRDRDGNRLVVHRRK